MTFVGPTLVVPWAILCLCFWFHPTRGTLQSSNRFIGRLPPIAQSALRWYASIFLIIFVLVGGVIAPLVLLAQS
ncbi:hypothetical protein SAMN05428948_3010 [Massilia sp. CF038]|nr:hypothetical protein SAMN05428948_3010 [Massilia sp. CF038]